MAYQKPPMLWEVFCSPDSELTNHTLQAGLCAYRINLAGGFDLYCKDTSDGLRQLRRRHKPLARSFGSALLALFTVIGRTGSKGAQFLAGLSTS